MLLVMEATKTLKSDYTNDASIAGYGGFSDKCYGRTVK